MKDLTSNILAIIAIAILVVVVLYKFINIPASIYHVGHLAFPPRDLYQPIIYDAFSFDKKNFSETYNLKPKYSDIYEIGLVSAKDDIPASYKFSGKVKFSFFSDGKLLFERDSLPNPSVFYSKKDNTKIRAIVLMTFDLPIMNKYKDNLSVKVTIVEEDKILKNYIDSVKLYIAVSSAP